MKNNSSILILAVLLIACSESKTNEKKKTEPVVTPEPVVVEDDGIPDSVAMQDQWIDYEDSENAYHWPMVFPYEGMTDELMTEVNKNLSIETILNTTIEDIEKEWEEYQNGITDFRYDIELNYNLLLSVSYSSEYLGAHLSYENYYRNIDLLTGHYLYLDKVIDPTFNADVIAFCDEMIRESIELSIEDAEANGDGDVAYDIQDFHVAQHDLENFTLDKEGIWFHIDVGIPHYARIYDPSASIQMKYKDIANWLTPMFAKRMGIEVKQPE